eukprot:TRINITY_DN32359_c0_g1_i1.p1 TRINITY_DN32359_c0_g1~~TRINITY_DN32359_c0_g1_i1.p1  ORF type:complete len:845 (-),score=129.85 TRINITY_DN32359_c0_g1_i1:831-3065(-)
MDQITYVFPKLLDADLWNADKTSAKYMEQWERYHGEGADRDVGEERRTESPAGSEGATTPERSGAVRSKSGNVYGLKAKIMARGAAWGVRRGVSMSIPRETAAQSNHRSSASILEGGGGGGPSERGIPVAGPGGAPTVGGKKQWLSKKKNGTTGLPFAPVAPMPLGQGEPRPMRRAVSLDAAQQAEILSYNLSLPSDPPPPAIGASLSPSLHVHQPNPAKVPRMLQWRGASLRNPNEGHSDLDTSSNTALKASGGATHLWNRPLGFRLGLGNAKKSQVPVQFSEAPRLVRQSSEERPSHGQQSGYGIQRTETSPALRMEELVGGIGSVSDGGDSQKMARGGSYPSGYSGRGTPPWKSLPRTPTESSSANRVAAANKGLANGSTSSRSGPLEERKVFGGSSGPMLPSTTAVSESGQDPTEECSISSYGSHRSTDDDEGTQAQAALQAGIVASLGAYGSQTSPNAFSFAAPDMGLERRRQGATRTQRLGGAGEGDGETAGATTAAAGGAEVVSTAISPIAAATTALEQTARRRRSLSDRSMRGSTAGEGATTSVSAPPIPPQSPTLPPGTLLTISLQGVGIDTPGAISPASPLSASGISPSCGNSRIVLDGPSPTFASPRHVASSSDHPLHTSPGAAFDLHACSAHPSRVSPRLPPPNPRPARSPPVPSSWNPQNPRAFKSVRGSGFSSAKASPAASPDSHPSEAQWVEEKPELPSLQVGPKQTGLRRLKSDAATQLRPRMSHLFL